MAGTRAGGKDAAKTNKKKYDDEYMAKYGMTFYQYNGHIGGKKGRTGGFASLKRDKNGLTGKQRAIKVGAVGGRISRRGKRVHE